MAKSQAPFNFDKALQTHAQDDTDYGVEFTRLPGGISGGKARLIELKFGVYQKGKYEGEEFFLAAGSVYSPKTAIETIKVFEDGKVKVKGTREVNVFGARTQIMVPLCDQERNGKNGPELITADEQVGTMLNELRKLGGEKCTAHIKSRADLIQLFEILKQKKPYFRFSTTQSDPNEQYDATVWENWYGTKGLEDWSPDQEAAPEDVTTIDESGEVGSAEEFQKAEETESGSATSASDEGPVNYQSMSLEELATQADEHEDTKAAGFVEKYVTEHGMSQEEVDSDEMECWMDVVKAFREKEGDEANADNTPEEPSEDAQESEEDEDTWKVGEICLYHPTNPKTKKPYKNPVNCEITEMDEEAETVVLKNTANQKVYKDVSLSDISVP